VWVNFKKKKKWTTGAVVSALIVAMNNSDKRPKRTLSTNGKNGQKGKNQNKNPIEESNWPIPSMEDSDWLLFTQN
jgi:hypothetical protein